MHGQSLLIAAVRTKAERPRVQFICAHQPIVDCVRGKHIGGLIAGRLVLFSFRDEHRVAMEAIVDTETVGTDESPKETLLHSFGNKKVLF